MNSWDTRANQVFAEALDSVPLGLLGKSLLSAELIRSLVFHLGNENWIGQLILGLSLHKEYPGVRANGAGVEVIVKLSLFVGVSQFRDDILETPLLQVS